MEIGFVTNQIHYNRGADLFTYLSDTSVFDIHDGSIFALEGSDTVRSAKSY